MTIDYASAGPFTEITLAQREIVAELPADPVAICRAVTTLMIHPMEAKPLGFGAERMRAQSIRPVAAILDEILALDPAPLSKPRAIPQRLVGTCRHFATVSVGLLRSRGIPARARCGFASYFKPELFVDHWIAEFWAGGGWVRLDPEHPDADCRGFFSGGEAWQLVRGGGADPMRFGVGGDETAWGPAEIRGNAIRDLAALVKIETLPWDEWGRMTESYQGETGLDYDQLIDTVAEVCAAADPVAVQTLYASEDLAVPESLLIRC